MNDIIICREFIICVFKDLSLVKNLQKSGEYSIRGFFEFLKSTIKGKELVQYTNLDDDTYEIKFSVPYRERTAPDYVNDEEWEDLKKDYPKYYDKDDDKFEIDDDVIWTEQKFGTHWRQTESTSWAEYYFNFENGIWKITASDDAKEIGGGNLELETENLDEALEQVASIAYDVYEGDTVERHKYEDWEKERDERAAEAGKREIKPDTHTQPELNFENLRSILFRR